MSSIAPLSPSVSPGSIELPAIVRVDPADQVGVALRPLAAGEVVTIDGGTLTVAEPIATGHKIALMPIAAGDDVRRYGWPIGRATQAIDAGSHVHSHNLATKLSGEEPYRYDPSPMVAPAGGRTHGFRGYVRSDGSVGTRNQIWVIPTVGCVGRTAQRVAMAAAKASGVPPCWNTKAAR